MKTCPLCRKEYDEELTVCPECGANESDSMSQSVEKALESNEEISDTEITEDVAAEIATEGSEAVEKSEEETATEGSEAVENAEKESEVEEAESDVKPTKKKKRGLAAAIVGIVFPSIAAVSSLITHLSVILITALVALVFPYLLALSPFAIPATCVITAIICLIACALCLIGFLVSVIALAAKGNKLGIAGLLMSIFFTVGIIVTEAMALAVSFLVLRAL